MYTSTLEIEYACKTGRTLIQLGDKFGIIVDSYDVAFDGISVLWHTWKIIGQQTKQDTWVFNHGWKVGFGCPEFNSSSGS